MPLGAVDRTLADPSEASLLVHLFGWERSHSQEVCQEIEVLKLAEPETGGG